jgi:hypothetical protein
MIKLGLNLPNFGPTTTCTPCPTFSPRIKARPTLGDVPGPDRPLGVGSLPQIRDDLMLLDSLGADTVVLDTNSDHPEARRAAVDDWRALQQIAACVDDIVARDPTTAKELR